MEPAVCTETETYLNQLDGTAPEMDTKRKPDEVEQVEPAIKRTKYDHSDEEESSSDESWAPSEESSAEEETDKPVPTRNIKTRSKGPASPSTAQDINKVMDGVDDEVDNESDFSSTTDEDNADDEESSDEEEEEDEESEGSDDEYSDDDSFVTSDGEECEEGCCDAVEDPK
jgi:hypothetical protein